MRALLALATALLLAACVSLGPDGVVAPHAYLSLDDAATATAPARRETPLVDALRIGALPADTMAETTSIAYSPRAGEFAFYRLASWTERPLRRLPRLLQQRLQARGVAAAVSLDVDAQRADWALVLRVEALHHDVSADASRARLVLDAELVDRRERTRVAQRRFTATVATTQPDARGAALGLSRATATAFDELVPWLEQALADAARR